MSARPAGLIVVTGTGTGVGKTFFTAVTLGLLRARGVTVAARKPVESFNDDGHPTDSEVLAAALKQARDARLHILDVMAEAIDGPVRASARAANGRRGTEAAGVHDRGSRR